MFGFDANNRELNFLVAFFAAQPEPVLRVRWRATIRQGASIAPGDDLGTVIFNDGSEIDMEVPAGISGTIAKVNRKIEYETIDQFPSQFALRLT
jgi:hypothetical protein